MTRDASRARRRSAALLGALLVVAAPRGAVAAPELPPGSPAGPFIVEAAPDAVADVAGAAVRLGGRGLRPLPLIDGFAVDLPAGAADRLARLPGVVAVVGDRRVSFSSASWAGGPETDEGAVHRIADNVIGADAYWRRGFTGAGVDVALLDTGVSPVPGLSGPGKVVDGANVSFDAVLPAIGSLDAYGHGTHLASIIAGRDEGAPLPPTGGDRKRNFYGMAPGARIVNVKVGNAVGLADVSQVIAAIGWVVEHRTADGLDIGVLALAFGTDGSQDYRVDPLAHAVEAAWRSGIVVVAAAGNDGTSAPLRNPASDPYVISVGAVESRGTAGTGDDLVLPFSNCGTGERPVDVYAPGKSVLGLRVQGSYIDETAPSARVGDRLFRGTGTSQAAAVVAGAAALVLDEHPGADPDDVKALLTGTARPVPAATGTCAAAGMIDLAAAAKADLPDADQAWEESTGSGSLEAARGSHHLTHDGVTLDGEIDIFGQPWPGPSGLSSSGLSWSGLSWSGLSWSGLSWSGLSWSGLSWSGLSWSGLSWSGLSWSGLSWSGLSWSDGSWSTHSWE